ncbi:MAG TPA: cupin domain-containing protein [Solirubrobacteraceae bacterium]|nr:cupin domain-containing protein [Solirubrobacteraceae bacterium]
MSSAVSIIRHNGAGEQMWFAGGGAFTWKATAAETGGAFILMEDRMEGGKVTPFHSHPNEDEALYVLEGELLVDIEGEQHRVGQGGFFFAPRGIPHAFMVTSETALVLALQTPGTGESFYREAGETVVAAADASRPADWARLREVAARSECIEILGPPPFKAPQHVAAAPS